MKILVPVDGSKHSMEGVNVALDYAKAKEADVILLTIIPPLAEFAYGLVPTQGDAVRSSFTQHAEEVIARAKEVLVANGVVPECIVKDATNAVAEEICDLVESEKVDVVVIGSHGLGEAGRFLMGSVASKVVRHCPCSVFVVRIP